MSKQVAIKGFLSEIIIIQSQLSKPIKTWLAGSPISLEFQSLGEGQSVCIHNKKEIIVDLHEVLTFTAAVVSDTREGLQ